MINALPSPEFEDEIRSAFDVQTVSPVFVSSLRTRLMQQSRQKSKQNARPFFLRPAWVVSVLVFLLLFITTMIIGPQRVLAAVRDLFGYIPGIGFVENSAGLRLLSEPVKVERQGISVSVEQGAADSQHTVLVYRVEGLSVQAANSQGEGASTGSAVALVLADGSILTQNGGEGTGWGTGFQWRLVFPPLPAGVNQATLMFARLETMPSGAAPENWQIPLHFKPAPPDMKIMPVYELPTALPTPAAIPSASPAPAGSAAVSTSAAAVQAQPNVADQQGIRFSLDRVAELPDGYLFQGRISWSPDQGVTMVNANTFQMKLQDGQDILIEETDPDVQSNPPGPNSSVWAVRSNRKDLSGVWQLSTPSLTVFQKVEVPVQIDFGPNPSIGVKQEINQTWVVAGHSLHASAFTINQKPDATLSVTIELGVDPGVMSIALNEPGNLPPPSGGGGGGGGPGNSTPGFTSEYAVGQKPVGVRSLMINGIDYLLNGPWQVSWQPPQTSSNVGVTPPPQDQPCLTLDKLQQIKAQPAAALPKELTGRLLVEEATGQLMPQLSIVDLQSGQSKVLGVGGWSNLSPDGATAVFIKSDGSNLFLQNTASLETKPLPGTLNNDYHPVWSADGKWIVLVRGSQGIYIIHPDGTGLTSLSKQPALISSPAGWMPDNQHLVITTLGAEGSTVQIVDSAGGAMQKQFVINNRKGGFVQLSPDGKRLSFAEMTFGLSSYGIYVANLDGTGKRLVAGLSSGDVSATTWSPDGKWLALVVMQWDGTKENDTPLLLQPDTCQIIPLPNLHGNIVSWRNVSP